ncbi:MAG: hypothetical protein ABIU20_05840 [Blastocatellia bacterium]
MWNQAERGQFRAFCLRAAAILVITNFVRDGVVKSDATGPRSDAAAAARVHARHNYTQTCYTLYATATACLPGISTDSARRTKDGLTGDAAPAPSR